MRSLDVSILLFDAFSNMVLACLLEPLRVVRDQTDAKIRWRILTENDSIVTSSSGLAVSPEMPKKEAGPSDLLLLIGGDAFRDAKALHNRPSLEPVMRAATVIAADTGAWVLAGAGYLDGHKATLHWQLLDEFREEFPDVEVCADRHVQDGKFWTCGTAAAALDLILVYIEKRFGASASFDAAAMFLHDNARRHGASYPAQALDQAVSPKLRQVVGLMAEAIENPRAIPSLAKQSTISVRSLHRLFVSELHTTPGRYYLLLRLARARELMRYSGLDENEIALRCGFANGTTLKRSLVRNFGSGVGGG